MTLNVGDIRQYYYETENIYSQWEVIDTTFRTDGRKVFAVEESMLLSPGLFMATTYWFIRDNSLWITELDTIGVTVVNETNQFFERKVANIFPEDGDYFLMAEGSADSERVFFKVKFIDSLTTYCGKFISVAEYEIINPNSLNSQLVYYASVYGHVGTKIENQNGQAIILTTYIKLKDVERGEYKPLTGAIINGIEYGTIVSIDEIPITIPRQIKLYQNYPNPFNSTTTITFSLENEAFVLLKIYNLLGNEIQILANDFHTSGRYNISFNADKLSSGIYIYKITAGSNTDQKKFVLMK